jgi:hypothetical protein
MATSKSDVEELKRLQQESQELRKRPKKRKTPTASATEQRPDGVARKTGDDKEATINLAVPIENIIDELERIVRERPALALLAAFGIGMVVVKLLERR